MSEKDGHDKSQPGQQIGEVNRKTKADQSQNAGISPALGNFLAAASKASAQHAGETQKKANLANILQLAQIKAKPPQRAVDNKPEAKAEPSSDQMDFLNQFKQKMAEQTKGSGSKDSPTKSTTSNLARKPLDEDLQASLQNGILQSREKRRFDQSILDQDKDNNETENQEIIKDFSQFQIKKNFDELGIISHHLQHKHRLRRRGIIRALEPVRVKWDLFIIVLAVYNSISLPIDLAFHPDLFRWNWMIVMDALIDVCFVADIAIAFRTTYMNPLTGDEVFCSRSIALNYVKGSFWIDLSSTIPFDKLAAYATTTGEVAVHGSTDRYQVISVLKLVRVLRLGKLINYLNQSDDLKLQLKLFKLCFFLVLYIHITGCLWYMICTYGDTQWEPNQWQAFLGHADRNVFPNEKFGKQEWPVQYIIVIYNAILQLTGNDIAPIDVSLVFTAITHLVVGALMNANVFGTLASIFSTLNRKSQKFQEQIDQANTTMKNIRLPEPLQEEIREYMMMTQNLQDNQRETNEFVTMLSPSLREEVMSQIFINAFIQNKVFKDELDVIRKIIQGLTPEMQRPDDIVVEIDTKPDFFFFIAEGQCQVSLLDHFQNEVQIKPVLEKGDYFGELAILNNCLRTATVRSNNYCTFAKIPKSVFLKCGCKFLKKIQHASLKYKDKLKQFKIQLLKQVEYFETYETENYEMFYEQIQYHLERRLFQKGDKLVSDGEKCGEIMFVVQGDIEIEVHNSKGECCTLDILKQGDIMGQYSILTETGFKFEANVLTDGYMFVLSKDFLLNQQHKIEGLSYAMIFANELVVEDGVPIQDYRIHQYNANKNRKFKNTKKYMLEEKIKQRFLDDIMLTMIKEREIPEASDDENDSTIFSQIVSSRDQSNGYSGFKILEKIKSELDKQTSKTRRLMAENQMLEMEKTRSSKAAVI